MRSFLVAGYLCRFDSVVIVRDVCALGNDVPVQPPPPMPPHSMPPRGFSSAPNARNGGNGVNVLISNVPSPSEISTEQLKSVLLTAGPARDIFFPSVSNYDANSADKSPHQGRKPYGFVKYFSSLDAGRALRLINGNKAVPLKLTVSKIDMSMIEVRFLFHLLVYCC